MSGKLVVEVLSVSVGKDGAKLWEKAEMASIKVELRDGTELQKGKTKQQARKASADGGFTIDFKEVLDFEVNDKLSGELRVQLCRAKNSGVAKGTKPIANAGIFVEKIVGFIKDKKKQISKSFTMYAVEGGGNGGTVMLKLNFIPKGASAPIGALAVEKAPAAVDLGEHQAAVVDESKDHVVTVKSHGSGPPVALIAGVLVVVAGAAALLLGGGGGAAAAAPAKGGKGGKPAAKGKK